MKRELEELLFEVKSSQEKLIIETLMANFEKIPEMKLEEIAKYSYCSKTSVRRIIIKLGYKGYLEYQLRAKLLIDSKSTHQSLRDDGKLSIEKCTEIIDFIVESNHISLYGAGADSISAQYLFRQLLEVGYTVTWINEIDLLHTVHEDNLIIISNSGRNPSVLRLIKELRENQNCKVAAITRVDTELSKIVDVSIEHDLKYSINKNDPMDAFIIINQIAKLL